MALIYPTIWEQGEQRERITPGYHYKKELKSLVVPAHQVVTIYENEDRQGKKVHASIWWYLSPSVLLRHQ